MYAPQFVHDYLVAHGYQYARLEADWEDVGGPESGPIISGRPAADVYTGDDFTIYIDERGMTHIEKRDPVMEAGVDEFHNQHLGDESAAHT